MNSDTFRRTSARRLAAATAAAALAAGPVLLAAPAQATGVEEHGGGAAHAAVLKAGLDVSLLNKTIDVPVNTSLNEVRAPQSADKKALSLTVDGVDKGRPFSMVSADVADARATVAGGKAEGYVNIVNAKVHVPGLRRLSLIAVRQVTAKATCEAGKHPGASANLLGDVTVLGKTVSLSTGGPTKVSVPDVGEVSLELSQTHTTSRTAAATALALDVSVNPLQLNVADVKGSVKLATADCTEPKPSGGHHGGGGTPSKPTTPATGEPSEAAPSAPDVRAQSATEPKPAKSPAQDLAETGSSSTTPYIAGGAAVLLLAGAGAVVLAKRRASH
ncbi:SCO1860 family LAETG-anchored protein [Streptomyces montanisoli]|uniref:LPXTG cell wall anchor domain-containing protein n=1 Tax=Streptomyces montanisoli TaxID=2798581 RepID=A0A940ML38_9ACTN|nr:SCO1860 family LAETG-anchored protein [Streptomyces montanisoli]MBP0461356.1 LPXTG cell wall anchor domain-containing protein [Streptomyces montanisoli]